MYRSHFNLQANPFTPTPNPQFFYLAPNHSESVAKCEYAILNKSGIAVVYGDVGTGKTTILNELQKRFQGKAYTIAVLNNPNQTSDTALLKAIAIEFGLIPKRNKQDVFDQLHTFLAEEIVNERTPLLLLDEAQDLRNSSHSSRDMLGMIKTLNNLMLENERLIQIILFGQLELIPILKKRRALFSRVAQFSFLSPLVFTDACAMLEHRWQTAGGQLPLPFNSTALKTIYTATKGLPRDIIKVANSALIHTYASGASKVDMGSATYAIQEHHLFNDNETDGQ